MNEVCIVTLNKFPRGDAGSIRLEYFAKMLLAAGYNVLVVCLGNSTNYNVHSYNGIKYISFRSANSTLLFRILDLLSFKKKLKKFCNGNCEKIIFTGLPINCLKYFKKLNKKFNTKLIYDCVEWYSASEFRLGHFSLSYIHNNLLNSKIINEQFSVISISSFLHEYYKNKNINSIKIPILLEEIPNQKIASRIDDRINLIYCGSPGRKDDLGLVFESLFYLDESTLNKIHFSIIGITQKIAFEKKYLSENVFNKIKYSIDFKGRISHNQVIDEYSKADFSILLRPANERYAKAGFPTKFVESLQMGIPVIANYSSDLHEYLKDNYNGFVIDKYDSISIADTLIKIVSLSDKEVEMLKINSLKTFSEKFKYMNFYEKFIEFIEH